jgi:hypothetical protein
MNTTNQNEQPAILQPTEAIPLEDNSLSASETLREQQTEVAEKESAPVFIP